MNIHRSGVLTALAWLVPHETAAVSAQVLCTPYNHAPCHFMQSHIRKVYACLAVTRHLHFRQNDRDLLPATAITRGWNGYQNERSQHRKSTLVEKKILPPLLRVCVLFERFVVGGYETVSAGHGRSERCDQTPCTGLRHRLSSNHCHSKLVFYALDHFASRPQKRGG